MNNIFQQALDEMQPVKVMTVDEMREEFEEYMRNLWANRNDPFLRPCNDIEPQFTYQNPDTEFAWVIWKAAKASQPDVEALTEVIKETDTCFFGQKVITPETAINIILKWAKGDL